MNDLQQLAQETLDKLNDCTESKRSLGRVSIIRAALEKAVADSIEAYVASGVAEQKIANKAQQPCPGSGKRLQCKAC